MTHKGFTLIELSIVLVIIGLIVGGVLVGRDLISAAGVRSQISQIEKYQTVANTFKGKFGSLPGDVPVSAASQFGFTSRGTVTSLKLGDGVILGPGGSFALIVSGESGLFWVDLTTAKLIDGNFTSATANAYPSLSKSQVDLYLPRGKMGGSVYVWSGGYKFPCFGEGDSINYYSLTNVTGTSTGYAGETPAVTAAEAGAIDKKMDDGLPQTGNVIALNEGYWAAGGPTSGTPPSNVFGGDADPTTCGPVAGGSGVATPATDDTCYDNANVTDATEKYSITRNNGRGLNCWLSFKFQ